MEEHAGKTLNTAWEGQGQGLPGGGTEWGKLGRRDSKSVARDETAQAVREQCTADVAGQRGERRQRWKMRSAWQQEPFGATLASSSDGQILSCSFDPPCFSFPPGTQEAAVRTRTQFTKSKMATFVVAHFL